MFRGLSSWFGLEQPAPGGRQSEGDGQPKGDAPPEQRSEAVAETAEGEPQQAGDQELLHQAKGLGSESLPGPVDQRVSESVRIPPPAAPGRGPPLVGGRREGAEGVSVVWRAWCGSGQGRSFILQSNPVPEVPGDMSLLAQCVTIASRAEVKQWGSTSLGLTRNLFFVHLANFPLYDFRRTEDVGELELVESAFLP